jgi:hypothetical protein
MFQLVLEAFKLNAFGQEERPCKKVFFREKEMVIVVMFNVALPVNSDPVLQSTVANMVTGMNSLEKDGVVVFQQILNQFF